MSSSVTKYYEMQADRHCKVARSYPILACYKTKQLTNTTQDESITK